jgi:hypothetical protein
MYQDEELREREKRGEEGERAWRGRAKDEVKFYKKRV